MKPRQILILVLGLTMALVLFSQFIGLFSDTYSQYRFIDSFTVAFTQYALHLGFMALVAAYLTLGAQDTVSAITQKVALVAAGISVIALAIGLIFPYGGITFFTLLQYFFFAAGASASSVGAIYIILRTGKNQTNAEVSESL